MKAIVFATVVLWTSLAWGECAWVLWTKKSVNHQPFEWDVVGAFGTMRECEAAGRAAEAAWYDTLKARHVTPQKLEALKFFPVCLPDTVDPRGPKR